MQRRDFRYPLVLVLLGVAIAVSAQGNRYPMLDMITQKVIQKYQTSTCQQLAANKAAPPTDMERRAVELLRQDPQLRDAIPEQGGGAHRQQALRVRLDPVNGAWYPSASQLLFSGGSTRVSASSGARPFAPNRVARRHPSCPSRDRDGS